MADELEQVITKEMVGLTVSKAFPTIATAVIEKTDLTAVKVSARDELIKLGLTSCVHGFEQAAGLAPIEIEEPIGIVVK